LNVFSFAAPQWITQCRAHIFQPPPSCARMSTDHPIRTPSTRHTISAWPALAQCRFHQHAPSVDFTVPCRCSHAHVLCPSPHCAPPLNVPPFPTVALPRSQCNIHFFLFPLITTVTWHSSEQLFFSPSYSSMQHYPQHFRVPSCTPLKAANSALLSTAVSQSKLPTFPSCQQPIPPPSAAGMHAQITNSVTIRVALSKRVSSIHYRHAIFYRRTTFPSVASTTIPFLSEPFVRACHLANYLTRGAHVLRPFLSFPACMHIIVIVPERVMAPHLGQCCRLINSAIMRTSFITKLRDSQW
jgi:hypothetical protein